MSFLGVMDNMNTRNQLSNLEIEVGLEKGTLTEGQIGEFVDLGYVTRRDGQAYIGGEITPDLTFSYASRTMRQVEADVFVTPGFVDYAAQFLRQQKPVGSNYAPVTTSYARAS